MRTIEEFEEANRCFESFLHFLTTHVKILDPPPGRGIIKWEPWPFLLEFAQTLIKFTRLVVLKGRQEGFSWVLAAYALWLVLFKRGSLVLVLSQGEDEAKEIIRKINIIYQNLPPMLQAKLTGDSLSHLDFGDNLSAIRALPSTERAGTGYTATLVICDEHAKHPYAEGNFASLEPTINAGAQFVSVSTMFSTGTFFRQLYIAAKEGINGFEPRFYSAMLRPGRDERWYEETKRTFEGLPHRFLLEYPCTEAEALSVVEGNPFFDLLALQRLREEVRLPIREEKEATGYLRIWQEPQIGRRYVMGLDVCYGYDTPDAGCGQVLEWQTGIHAASLWGKHPPEVLAEKAVALCKQYRDALLAVEVQGVGQFVLKRISQLGYSSPGKLYHRDWQKKYAKNELCAEAGWSTDKSTRPVMMAELAEAIRLGALTTHDQETINELGTCVIIGDKPQAARGAHDDRLMALAIAWQMRQLPVMMRDPTRMPANISFIGKR